MKIKDIPWFNRPGFKLTRNGASSLDDAELLSIIFGFGNKKESALELSNKLLRKYNFNRLENLSVKDLAKECNWDYNKALQIFSLVEICKRYNKLINNGYSKSIKNAEDVYNIFADKMSNYNKEVLSLILLDTKNKIIGIKEGISIGTLNNSLIHPREVFKEAIKEGAFAIMLIHNHPSGDPKPSEEDIKITKQIIKAGKMLNILVLDHIIVGNGSYWNWLDSQS